jgi:hypothetical protein
MARQQFLLLGQDALMNTSLEHRIGNAATFVLQVDKTIRPNSIYKTLVARIGRALRDPSHYLRARQNLRDMRYYHYTQEEARRLAKRIIRCSDKRPTYLELGERLVESEMSAIICVYQNTFYITITHLFIDGIKTADLIGLCLDHPIIDYSFIPTFSYTPVWQELTLIPGLIRMMTSLSREPGRSDAFPSFHRFLSVDSDWKRELQPIQHKKYTNRLGSIKRIKGYLSKRFTSSFSFSATLAVISAIYALENTTKDSLNVGILSGFRNETRFNNFSAIIIRVVRPDEWQFASLLDRVHAVAAQVHSAMASYGKEYALIAYLVTNVYNVNWYTNELVDCLVSCAPTPGRVMFHGREASLLHSEMCGTTVPMYIGFYTSNECVRTGVISRSRELHLETKDTLQIDEMNEQIP